MAVSFIRDYISLCSAFAASGALSPSTGASFSPTRVISWRSKIPTTKRSANDRGQKGGFVVFASFYWFLFMSIIDGIIRKEIPNNDAVTFTYCIRTSAAMLISSTPWMISLQKAASTFLRLWSSSSLSTSECSLTEGSRWSGSTQVMGEATISQKSEKSKEQSRAKCFSLIQDNGFNRWKSKITEG